MNYATYVTTLANLLVVEETDPNFIQILPTLIDYAEQRIYRELDLLDTVTRDTGLLTVGTRSFILPQTNGRFVVTNGFNVITPATTSVPDLGTRVQLVPVSRDYMDAIWNSPTSAGTPQCYCPVTDQLFMVGPFPDAGYTVEVIGTIRPTPLSVSNSTTYLTLYLPDIFLAASMVEGSAYQQNFGAQADNPQMAQSWETQYGKLFASANTEEMRKKYSSGAWGSLQPTPIATPSR